MRSNSSSASSRVGARSVTLRPLSTSTSDMGTSCIVAGAPPTVVHWIDMAITFNHTIVAAKNRRESADFFTELFGLPSAKEFGHFLAVGLNHGASLDYAQVAEGEEIRPQHYAFLVSEDEFS